MLYQANNEDSASTFYRHNERWVEGRESPAILQHLIGLRNGTGENNCFLNVNVQAILALPALLDIFKHLAPGLRGDSRLMPYST